MTTLLYILFPLLCILAIPKQSRPGAFAQRLVFGIALYEFLLFVTGIALGLTHHLTPRSYQAATWSLAIILAALAWQNGIHPDPVRIRPWLRTRRGAAALLLATLVAVAFGLQLGFDARYGTRHFDGLWYHIPRVIFWLQQGSFDAWPTPMWGHVGLPVGADVILGQKILLGEGWRGVGYVTCLLSLGAVLCVYLAALDLGLRRWHAVMAAILLGSFPAVGLRIWSVSSDMAAAFPVLASYLVLHRVGNPRFAVAIYLALSGLALACKPTVAPHALLLGGFAFWQLRHKILQLRSFGLPVAAAALAAAFVVASYWPVYAAFADFQGGEPGRGHKTGSALEFAQAVALNAGHWILEPLGYLTPIMKSTVISAAEAVYNLLGAHITELPESWKPWPSQDVGRSGLASVLLAPALLLGLPARARLPATLLFLSGFASLSGMLHFHPYAARYTVILLAGYALLYAGTGFFRRGSGRWILAALVCLNVSALLGVVSARGYLDATRSSRPSGMFHYLSDQDRYRIVSTLAGRPLLVLTTGDSLDALLVGPDIAFPLSYLMSPTHGDWGRELRSASLKSNWLAVVHQGGESIEACRAWPLPGPRNPPALSKSSLNEALTLAGWRLYRHNELVDLWTFP